MLELEVLQDEITPWVKSSMAKEDIGECEVEVTGKTEKGENYAGDVIFVKVHCSQGKEINLVIKMGKKNKVMREKFSIKEIYLREVTVYDKIFPAFKNFQQVRGVKNPFDCYAKCYSTLLLEDTEVLVFENLKDRGFEMHDRQNTFNDQHLEIVLRNYAKFHALSFAMKDQDREKFEALTKDYTCIPEIIMLQPIMEEWYKVRVTAVVESIKKVDEELAKKLEKFFQQGGLRIMEGILKDELDEKERVITHGDCWNSNFMFKYQGEDKETPTDVIILDWQISSFHTPVLDLSYFLHIVSSGDQLSDVEKYLSYYHEHLAKFIKELGSDPEKLFPYSSLERHWNKYSAYGVVWTINALEMMMCDKDDAISFDDFQDGEEIEKDMEKFTTKIKAKNSGTYEKRIVGVMKSFLKNKNL